MKTVLIVDTSSILHQVGKHLAAFKTSTGVPTAQIYNFVIRTLSMKQFMVDEIIFALDAGRSGRDDESDTYKANRANRHHSNAQVVLPFLKNLRCQIIKKDGFEADDVIYTLCEQYNKDDSVSGIIVLSKDYDLSYTLVFNKVRHFLTNKSEMNEHALFMRHGCFPQTLPLYKAIFGDSSDNIKPVKGLKKKPLQSVFMVCTDPCEIIQQLPRDRAIIEQVLANVRLIKMKLLKDLTITNGTFNKKLLKKFFDRYELSNTPDQFTFMR